MFMVFDVESMGLHGEGFSVGWWVIDRQGKRIASAQYACDPAERDCDPDDYAWLITNVPRPGQGYNCRTPRHVRDEFWRAWEYAKKQGAMLAADCPWPVEARFLHDCVADDPENRKWSGPYPLLDITSVRLAAGLDPLGTCGRLPNELPAHDPLCDSIQSARLLIEALNLIANKKSTVARPDDTSVRTEVPVEAKVENPSAGLPELVADDLARGPREGWDG